MRIVGAERAESQGLAAAEWSGEGWVQGSRIEGTGTWWVTFFGVVSDVG